MVEWVPGGLEPREPTALFSPALTCSEVCRPYRDGLHGPGSISPCLPHLSSEVRRVKVLYQPGQVGALRPVPGIVEAGALHWDLWGLGSQSDRAPSWTPEALFRAGWQLCAGFLFSCDEFQEERGGSLVFRPPPPSGPLLKAPSPPAICIQDGLSAAAPPASLSSLTPSSPASCARVAKPRPGRRWQ